MSKILIVGAGMFGIAIGQTLLLNKNHVSYFANSLEVADHLKKGEFKGYPTIKLEIPAGVYTDYNEALETKYDYIILAVPSDAIEEVWKKITTFLSYKVNVINIAKGINENEPWSKLILENPYVKEYGCISGPSFAKEIVEKKKTIVNLACTTRALFDDFSKLINNDFFKVLYLPIDIELACTYVGALKNAIAIGMGIIDYFEDSRNTYAALVTIAIADVLEILKKLLKVEHIDFVQPYALGDILLTTSSKMSRNYSFGRLVGEHGLDKAYELSKDVTVEGCCTIQTLKNIQAKNHLHLAFFDPLIKVFDKEIKPEDFPNTIWKEIK